jgi:hypothetical protein
MSNQVNYTISPINSNNTILQILKKIELYLQEHPIPTDVVTEEYVQTMINTLCVKKTDVLSEITGTSDNPVSSRAINARFNEIILNLVGIVQQLNGKANASEVISSLGGKTGAVTLGNGLSIDDNNVLSASGGSGDDWTLLWSGLERLSTSGLTIPNLSSYANLKIEYKFYGKVQGTILYGSEIILNTKNVGKFIGYGDISTADNGIWFIYFLFALGKIVSNGKVLRILDDGSITTYTDSSLNHEKIRLVAIYGKN